jgi:hypothetical protein
MLNRLFLTSLLLAPTATWAACSSHQVGALTFSNCPAEGHAVTHPVASGVVVHPLSDSEVKPPPPVRLVRPHEIVDMGESKHRVITDTGEGMTNAPAATDVNGAGNKTKAQNKPVK